MRDINLQLTWMVEIDVKLNATNPDGNMNVFQLQKLNENNQPASGEHGIKTPQGKPILYIYR